LKVRTKPGKRCKKNRGDSEKTGTKRGKVESPGTSGNAIKGGVYFVPWFS